MNTSSFSIKVLFVCAGALLLAGCGRQSTSREVVGDGTPSSKEPFAGLAHAETKGEIARDQAEYPATKPVISETRVASPQTTTASVKSIAATVAKIGLPGGEITISDRPAARSEAAASPGAGAEVDLLPLPLAAVGSNPALKLDAQQTEAMTRLSEDFLAATEEKPVSTPASAEKIQDLNTAKWLVAQRQSDERFRSMFGWEAFNAQLLHRSQQDYAAREAAEVPLP